MAKTVSVVTPERFALGFTYKDYLAQIKVNQDRFQRFYDEFKVNPADAQAIRRLVRKTGGPAKVLALAEDWCPDVYRGLPVMAKVAEASGMELRVFPRDQNLDIMSEFLNQGQHQSVPTFVFYTRDHHYIAHWIERPKLANEEMASIRAEVEKAAEGKPEEERRKAMREAMLTRYPAWQQETVREIEELLSGV